MYLFSDYECTVCHRDNMAVCLADCLELYFGCDQLPKIREKIMKISQKEIARIGPCHLMTAHIFYTDIDELMGCEHACTHVLA